MRKLSAAMYRHWDHVMAVLDVDYAPNGTLCSAGCGVRTASPRRLFAAGQEFVSASYDNTVRLWNCTAQRSKEALGSRYLWCVRSCGHVASLASLCRSIMESECSYLAAPSTQKSTGSCPVQLRRVLCCHFTPDGRFVLSGSEDTNIRVWKAAAPQKT